MAEYLSTREVASYLRLNQKKIYALVAAGEMPAARISGKWLFSKALVDGWVAGRTVHPTGGLMQALLDTVVVLQGSDDWLLSRLVERYQERSGTPVPTASVGSLAGLSALGEGRAHLAGCHVEPQVARHEAGTPVYLLGLFEREQGIIVDRRRTPRVEGLAGLARRALRFAVRQERSGTHRLVSSLLAAESVEPRWTPVGPYHSHLEVALAVRGGDADAGFGSRIAAHLAGLDFLPVAREEFDLAIPAHLLSHPKLAGFLEFCVDELGARRRHPDPGYSFEQLGRLQPLTRSP